MTTPTFGVTTPNSAESPISPGNISSATLDQQEVHDIASQLKQGLEGAESKAQPKTEATIPLDTPHDGDEIVIDKDGNMRGSTPV